jgi:hypothetical protein
MPRRRQLNFEVLNADEISNFFIDLGRVPQKSVRKAARAGANLIKRRVSSSSLTPVKQGFLKASIKLVEEKKQAGKRNKTGKAGFDVTFAESYNNIFQKFTKPGGKGTRGSLNPKDMYYYPASMEYGFMTNKGKIPGRYFMKTAAASEELNVQNKMIEVLSKDIDAIKRRR